MKFNLVRRRQPIQHVIDVTNIIIEELVMEKEGAYIRGVYREECTETVGKIHTIYLLVGENSTILDETRNTMEFHKLEPGMVINATIPRVGVTKEKEYLSAMQIYIINREEPDNLTQGKVIRVNLRKRYIITTMADEEETMVYIYCSKSTIIYDSNGRRLYLRNLRPGTIISVEHEALIAASLPVQIVADVIRVL